ncbi:hypothetical protein MLD38_001070 [Melastoma candidum]|uniref:Uncharacterized protein n=1 Tax=Melastoma candidum TaxID=119954 RepID=A0ACB9SBY9_9MYRT|nr:hypothetical protein MLD38_001070 [Melastoma candidum]
MTMDREKEREIELESAMYTNCLLLGLDPSVIGSNGTPRVGLFRHSNPKLGEHLLHFLLSALRGPVQSAKDFDRVWPIFDSAQSRDFRKVVQGIISELESQGALPRSNSRVSSLATCCGARFVELLWQLSLHALREVHRRTFATDVATNPLPAPLTDVAFSHAATLLPVTKARIALERRRFLKNAETAVQRQAMWSNLAHEMTAEFRGLCAEEAYLQQELEKLHDLRNKVKLEGELWDDLMSSSSQNSHLVAKATRLWESILARKSQHEVLASGPIEDLIAHREHRYRISGSALLAAMDQSSQGPHADVLSIQADDAALVSDEKDENDELTDHLNRLKSAIASDPSNSQANDVRVDDRSGRMQPTVDVAEIIRRWTHALQRIHKHSLLLAKANDGEGPEILRNAKNGSASGHVESLSATLVEHQQHLASFQVLINQLKEVAPAIQRSISECTEQVNSFPSAIFPITKSRNSSFVASQSLSSGRGTEPAEVISELTSKLSSVQLDKASVPSQALKLPQLFTLTPNSSGKMTNLQKRQVSVTQKNLTEATSEKNPVNQILVNNQSGTEPQDADKLFILDLKKSVRQAALSTQPSRPEQSKEAHSSEGSENLFLPLSCSGYGNIGSEHGPIALRNNRLFSPHVDSSTKEEITGPDSNLETDYDEMPDVMSDLALLNDFDQVNGFFTASSSNRTPAASQSLFYDIDGSQDHVFSPPLLMESSLLADTYEDLLAPLSETETALMEH